MLPDLDCVLAKLNWMQANRIWPNAMRSVDRRLRRRAPGLALRKARKNPMYLDCAERLVAEVDRVLGRPRGLRIGQEPYRDGQYFHYLAMWLYALAVLVPDVPIEMHIVKWNLGISNRRGATPLKLIFVGD